jgi:hypothetical protein
MKSLPGPRTAAPARRGAALLLSFMVLVVLILILAQIKYSTDTAGRVARNEETVIAMDLAIESALLQVYEDLKTDGESDAAGASGAADPLEGAAPPEGGAAPAGGENGPTDSREDGWARPQRTEINEIQLRILIQDEDSKYNVLSVLTEDEDEAEKAFERLVRVIEYARKGTDAEIDGNRARALATAMAEYMRRRSDQVLPRPQLISDDEENEAVGLPLSLREFMAIDPELFEEDLFRDFIDQSGQVVHSLSSFLTVWTSIATADEAAAEEAEPGQPEPEPEPEPGEDLDGDGQPDPPPEPGEEEEGEPEGPEEPEEEAAEDPSGWAVNINTAPVAVLRSLMEDRDLTYRFWDDVVHIRNEADEEVAENEDPPLDEYGREITVKRYFKSLDDLAEIEGWENLEPIVQGELRSLLKTSSNVFSIFVTARRPTGLERIDLLSRQEDIEREEAEWQGLVRTVRCVVWRRVLGDGQVEIVPLVRWEVLDYSPYEVLDDPEERRFR